MLENTIDATEIKSSDELLKAIEGLKNDGYRYSTMICQKADEGHDLIYIFEKDNRSHITYQYHPVCQEFIYVHF